jgi:hypothetical protein
VQSFGVTVIHGFQCPRVVVDEEPGRILDQAAVGHLVGQVSHRGRRRVGHKATYAVLVVDFLEPSPVVLPEVDPRFYYRLMGLEHVLMVPMVEFIGDVARVGFNIGETRKGGKTRDPRTF